MTESEAKEFRRQLVSIAFPGLRQWFESLPEPEETWKLWRDTLRPYTLDECLSVVRRWATGELKPFEAYERERVHLMVRAIVERDRYLARAKNQNAETCKPVVAKKGSLVSPVLATAVRMAGAGVSRSEIQDYIDKSFPASAEYDQPRYRCHACLDKGYVEIWSPAEVKRFTEQAKERPTCLAVVNCSCSDRDGQRFDPARHCRVLGWHSLDEQVETLRVWISERSKIEYHPNYNSEFGDLK